MDCTSTYNIQQGFRDLENQISSLNVLQQQTPFPAPDMAEVVALEVILQSTLDEIGMSVLGWEIESLASALERTCSEGATAAILTGLLRSNESDS